MRIVKARSNPVTTHRRSRRIFATIRRRLTLRHTGGAALLVIAFLIWMAVVQPVNTQVAHSLAADPGSGPAIWSQLRTQWEYGHAAGFVAQLLGFSALVISVLADESPA